MPRRRQPPRLYFDATRASWVIRDGTSFIRTGCAAGDESSAAQQLARYLASKHQPPPSDDPLIVDVLNVYAREHLVHTATAGNASYTIAALAAYSGALRVSDITPDYCRRYANQCRSGWARRNLATLRAAVRFYQRARRAGFNLPTFILPPKAEPRTRWLTRSEAARLLWAARRIEHLRRFILLGLYTGSRSKNIFGLRWSQIDFGTGVMQRRGFGELAQGRKRSPPVRLGRRILRHLSRWRALDGLAAEFVVHWQGKPIRKFSMTWGKAVRGAGLEGTGVTPHSLRRTRATWLLQAGVDIWEAAGHLGMSPEMLTRVYGVHDPRYQQRAAEV